ncbi:hypothetical protein TNCV_4805971 [Trichonephila clavipes]|nr:hypothetical protein TNCV_4805971 [Trichonephila clavipes]
MPVPKVWCTEGTIASIALVVIWNRSLGNHDASGWGIAYRVPIPQVRDSNLGLGKFNSTYHSFSGVINVYQACLGTKHLRFRDIWAGDIIPVIRDIE